MNSRTGLLALIFIVLSACNHSGGSSSDILESTNILDPSKNHYWNKHNHTFWKGLCRWKLVYSDRLGTKQTIHNFY